MKTRITELLGIRYPVICAGMSGVATPELAAAVSNAGGLGLINLTTLNPDQAHAALAKIRCLTDKPFGINMTQLLPAARTNIAIAIDAEVPVINTSFGKCDWYRDDVHRYGGKIIVTTSTLRHALAAQEQGADAVIVTSYEAAAHAGDIVPLPCNACRRFHDLTNHGGFVNQLATSCLLFRHDSPCPTYNRQ